MGVAVTVAAADFTVAAADSMVEREAGSTAERAEGSAAVVAFAVVAFAVVAFAAVAFAAADFGGGINFSSALGIQVGVTLTPTVTVTPTPMILIPRLILITIRRTQTNETGYADGGGQPASCPRANGAPLYQIKLTYQNNIYLAQKYWYTPGTLNFITAQGEEKKKPINTIDQVTFQLNQSCGLKFTVPQ